MRVLAGDDEQFSSTKFNTKFARVVVVLNEGSHSVLASYEAQGLFALGDNMAGVCGGSGQCSWVSTASKTSSFIKAKKA
jgi:hypothetical protein